MSNIPVEPSKPHTVYQSLIIAAFGLACSCLPSSQCGSRCIFAHNNQYSSPTIQPMFSFNKDNSNRKEGSPSVGGSTTQSGTATPVFGAQSSQPALGGFSFGNSQAAQGGQANKPAFLFNKPAENAGGSKPAFLFGAKPAELLGLGAPANPQPLGSLFGGSQGSTPSGTPAFGSKANSPAPSGGLFGAKPADKPAGTPLFGAKPDSKLASPAPGLFGAKKDDAGAAGASGFSFGNKDALKPAAGGLFGAKADDKPASGGLFGAKPAENQAAAPSGGMFGAKTDDKPAGGLFGAKKDESASSGPLFGAKKDDKPASGGLFGNKDAAKPAAGGLFGNKDESKPAAGGLFGAKKDDEKKDAPSGGLFGAKKDDDKKEAPSGGLFGAKKDEKKDAPAGGLFGAKKDDDKKDAPAGGLFGAKKDDEKKDAPAAGGLFGAKKDDKPETTFGTAEKKDATDINLKPTTIQPMEVLIDNKTIDDLITKWLKQLTATLKIFDTYTTKVKDWDQQLIKLGDEIVALDQDAHEAEQLQTKIDQQLKFVELQQDELDKLLDNYEQQADTLLSTVELNAQGDGVADPSNQLLSTDKLRQKAYHNAEVLDERLDLLGKLLLSLVGEVNGVSDVFNKLLILDFANATGDGKGANPIEEIIKLLNLHLENMKYIEGAENTLKEKLARLQKQ